MFENSKKFTAYELLNDFKKKRVRINTIFFSLKLWGLGLLSNRLCQKWLIEMNVDNNDSIQKFAKQKTRSNIEKGINMFQIYLIIFDLLPFVQMKKSTDNLSSEIWERVSPAIYSLQSLQL